MRNQFRPFAVSVARTAGTWVALLLALVLVFPLHAQIAGSLETTFTADVHSVSGGTVNSVVVQPNGHILVAGQFKFVGGLPRNGIARLNSDGTVETTNTFNVGTGPNKGFFEGEVFAVIVQTNGQIVIGGDFTNVNGEPRGGIARLNPDGTLESTNTFNPGSGVNAGFAISVRGLALQPDGKILMVGRFTGVNGESRNGIARLNADGTVESTNTFNIGSGALGDFGSVDVSSVAVQGDGKILVGGGFTSINGVPVNRIARLNPDGTVEASATFNPDPGPHGPVTSIAVQTDGKILVGGGLFSFAGVSRNGIARLEMNGAVESDATFNPGSGVMVNFSGGNVHSIAVQTDGKIVIGGIFTSVGGQPRNGIARLEANGAVESLATFDPGSGAAGSFSNPNVNSVAVQSDGKILLGGNFIGVDENPRRLIARLNSDGSFESTATFDPGVVSRSFSSTIVNATAVQPDKKILIGGHFQLVNGQPRGSIARLFASGVLEDTATFNPGFGTTVDAPVYVVGVQTDGKILMGGQFTTVGGQSRYKLARLLPNGVVESRETFDPVIAAFGTVTCLALQADGKILIGGAFSLVGGQPRANIARLLTNGVVDPDFSSAGTSGTFGGRVQTIAVQADGKILIGGEFTTVGDAARNGIARLDVGGTNDPTFDPSSQISAVNCLAVQPDGRILVSGEFSNRIARLETSGAIDPTFTPGTGVTDGFISSIALQADGKILVAGAFSQVNNQPQTKNMARLHSTGIVESSSTFHVDMSGSDDDNSFAVNGITLQADGKILIGGQFTSLEEQPRRGFARLLNDAGNEDLTVPSVSRVQWLRGGSLPEVEQVTFELSTDSGENWVLLGAGTRIPGGWEITGLNLPENRWIRARGRTVSGERNGSSGLVESLLTGSGGVFQLRISSIEIIPAGVRIRFIGLPGQSYHVERGLSVLGPWNPIVNPTAPMDGLIEHLDTEPLPGSGFYRIVNP